MILLVVQQSSQFISLFQVVLFPLLAWQVKVTAICELILLLRVVFTLKRLFSEIQRLAQQLNSASEEFEYPPSF
jgi:hypothetical protein